MRFRVKWASMFLRAERHQGEVMEFATLDDLRAFQESDPDHSDLILDFFPASYDEPNDGLPRITVYDDYLE